VREEGQAAGEMTRKRSEKESPILRICLKSIGPAEDTLSDRFINSNQDLVYPGPTDDNLKVEPEPYRPGPSS
jgi:hypothetical protein